MENPKAAPRTNIQNWAWAWCVRGESHLFPLVRSAVDMINFYCLLELLTVWRWKAESRWEP